MAQKKILRLEMRPCDATEAKALDLPDGDPVLVCEGLSLAGTTPVAHFLSIFPERRLPNMEASLRDVTSITEALRRNGVTDYVRVETKVTAEQASAVHALHLGLREGDPILRTEGRNCDLSGTPVELGITYFAGDRVTLVVDGSQDDTP
jgi:GntR family phosphonate transport system transcriptional regulator